MIWDKVKAVTFLKLPFYPSMAAFTFPFVISACTGFEGVGGGDGADHCGGVGGGVPLCRGKGSVNSDGDEKNAGAPLFERSARVVNMTEPMEGFEPPTS